MRVSRAFPLTVAAVISAGAVCVIAQTQNVLQKSNGGGGLVDSTVYESAGKVGIGTAVPAGNLHVAGAPSYIGTIRADCSGGNCYSSFGLFEGATYRASLYWHYGAGAAAFYGAPTWWFETGKVGIWTSTPQEKLHVAGNARIGGNVTVDGNIAAKYQDVAEWVDAASFLEPGTVVVIQESATNGVEASQRAYDSAVAGVVSAQPGVVLGEPGAGKALVAQSGRVRVKVDAGTSGIKPGDLLVTSGVEGHAMKSKPLSIGGAAFHRPGTVLGKALQPLPKGRGEILVLITLQ